MGKQINRLTAAFVKKAGPGMFADGAGLWMKCTQGADGLNKSWVFRYAVVESDEERRQRKAEGRRQGERQMGLGSVATVDLATARKLAAEKRLQRAGGTDPLATLDAQKDTRRLEKVAAEAVKEASRPEAPRQFPRRLPHRERGPLAQQRTRERMERQCHSACLPHHRQQAGR
jgi:Arm DNA-binding domain